MCVCVLILLRFCVLIIFVMNAVVCAWSFVLSVVCGFFFCCPLSSSYLGRVRRYRAVMNDALPVSRARVVCLPVLPFLVSSAAHLEDIHAGLAFLSGITKTTGVNQSSPTHPFHATTIQHSNIWIQNYWTSSERRNHECDHRQSMAGVFCRIFIVFQYEKVLMDMIL